MADFYNAELVGPDGTETIELEFIAGLPQKSIVRAAPGFEDDSTEDIVWELDEGAKEIFRYEQAGRPERDYS
ncbi:MAG TPA: hypothetical protein VGM94_02150 [Galbitalea sp.]|jgi:hypothetical protein